MKNLRLADNCEYGTRLEHYEEILVYGKPVYFVDEMFEEEKCLVSK